MVDTLDLQPEARKEHALVAEYLLGIDGLTLSAEKLDIARLAVAHQIVFQVQAGVEPRLYVSKSRGARSWTFSDVAKVGVDSFALTLARRLTTDDPDAYTVVKVL